MAVSLEGSPRAPWETQIQINIDCKFPKKNRRIHVKGEDATWFKAFQIR